MEGQKLIRKLQLIKETISTPKAISPLPKSSQKNSSSFKISPYSERKTQKSNIHNKAATPKPKKDMHSQIITNDIEKDFSAFKKAQKISFFSTQNNSQVEKKFDLFLKERELFTRCMHFDILNAFYFWRRKTVLITKKKALKDQRNGRKLEIDQKLVKQIQLKHPNLFSKLHDSSSEAVFSSSSIDSKHDLNKKDNPFKSQFSSQSESIPLMKPFVTTETDNDDAVPPIFTDPHIHVSKTFDVSHKPSPKLQRIQVSSENSIGLNDSDSSDENLFRETPSNGNNNIKKTVFKIQSPPKPYKRHSPKVDLSTISKKDKKENDDDNDNDGDDDIKFEIPSLPHRFGSLLSSETSSIIEDISEPADNEDYSFNDGSETNGKRRKNKHEEDSNDNSKFMTSKRTLSKLVNDDNQDIEISTKETRKAKANKKLAEDSQNSTELRQSQTSKNKSQNNIDKNQNKKDKNRNKKDKNQKNNSNNQNNDDNNNKDKDREQVAYKNKEKKSEKQRKQIELEIDSQDEEPHQSYLTPNKKDESFNQSNNKLKKTKQSDSNPNNDQPKNTQEDKSNKKEMENTGSQTQMTPTNSIMYSNEVDILPISQKDKDDSRISPIPKTSKSQPPMSQLSSLKLSEKSKDSKPTIDEYLSTSKIQKNSNIPNLSPQFQDPLNNSQSKSAGNPQISFYNFDVDIQKKIFNEQYQNTSVIDPTFEKEIENEFENSPKFNLDIKVQKHRKLFENIEENDNNQKKKTQHKKHTTDKSHYSFQKAEKKLDSYFLSNHLDDQKSDSISDIFDHSSEFEDAFGSSSQDTQTIPIPNEKIEPSPLPISQLNLSPPMSLFSKSPPEIDQNDVLPIQNQSLMSHETPKRANKDNLNQSSEENDDNNTIDIIVDNNNDYSNNNDEFNNTNNTNNNIEENDENINPENNDYSNNDDNNYNNKENDEIIINNGERTIDNNNDNNNDNENNNDNNNNNEEEEEREPDQNSHLTNTKTSPKRHLKPSKSNNEILHSEPNFEKSSGSLLTKTPKKQSNHISKPISLTKLAQQSRGISMDDPGLAKYNLRNSSPILISPNNIILQQNGNSVLSQSNGNQTNEQQSDSKLTHRIDDQSNNNNDKNSNEKSVSLKSSQTPPVTYSDKSTQNNLIQQDIEKEPPLTDMNNTKNTTTIDQNNEKRSKTLNITQNVNNNNNNNNNKNNNNNITLNEFIKTDAKSFNRENLQISPILPQTKKNRASNITNISPLNIEMKSDSFSSTNLSSPTSRPQNSEMKRRPIPTPSNKGNSPGRESPQNLPPWKPLNKTGIRKIDVESIFDDSSDPEGEIEQAISEVHSLSTTKIFEQDALYTQSARNFAPKTVIKVTSNSFGSDDDLLSTLNTKNNQLDNANFNVPEKDSTNDNTNDNEDEEEESLDELLNGIQNLLQKHGYKSSPISQK